MKLQHMDNDLTKITDPDQLSKRLSYWETRWQLTHGRTIEQEREYDAIRFKHSLRCAKVMGAG
jgi:hypothetical protein